MKSDFLPKYIKTIHKSGLEIRYCPKNSSLTYIKLKVGFGASDRHYRQGGVETLLPSGVAHFLEHKLFENEHGEDVTQDFAALGAYVNAYTTDDETVYEFSCSENTMRCISLLIDFVTHPHFTRKSIAKERPIIAEESRMYKNQPESRISQMLLGSMYRYAHTRDDIVGRISDLARINPDMLYSVHSAFYTPGNMALIIAGNVNLDAVISLCDERFFDSPHERPTVLDPNEPPDIYRRRCSAHMDISHPICAVGLKSDPLPFGNDGLRKQAADELLTKLYFEEGSPFSISLYEDGITSEAPPYAELTQSHRTSNLQYIAKTRDPKLFFDKFMRYLGRIRDEAIDPARLDRVWRAHMGRQIMASDSAELICDILTEAALCGRDLYAITDMQMQLGCGELQDELMRFADPDRISMATILPISK